MTIHPHIETLEPSHDTIMELIFLTLYSFPILKLVPLYTYYGNNPLKTATQLEQKSPFVEGV